jgi:hypothetical protein
VTGKSIWAFLADDNAIAREGVHAMLTLEPDLEMPVEARHLDPVGKGTGIAGDRLRDHRRWRIPIRMSGGGR